MMRPCCITQISSQCWIVLRRCAITKLVRPSSILNRASCTKRSLSVSERAGGFIEDQDRRVLQHRTCNPDTLLLPTAQAVPAIADVRLVAILQLQNEIVCIGDARSSFDIGHRHSRRAESDVVRDRIIE